MAAIGTFWSTNGTGSTNLIEATPGDAYTQPYTILPGSPGVDYTNPQVWIDAGLIFPDALPGAFPDQPDFDTATLADFTAWHSRHQADFILEKGTTSYSPDPGLPLPVPLPVGTMTIHSYSFTAGPTVVLGQDGRTIHMIEALSLSDIATMSLADQEMLAGLSAFQAKATELLMRPATGETAATVRTEMTTLVDALITEIQSTTNYSASDRDTFLAEFLNDPSVRVQNYPHFFVEQLNLYKLRLDQQALFSEGRIKEFLEDLQKRFERVQSYFNVSPETVVAGSLPRGVNAFDAGATMASGLNIFVEMESQLFQIALARAYLVATGTLIEPVQGKLISTQALIDAAYDTANSTYRDFGSFLTAEATNIYSRITAGTSNQRLLDGPNMIFVLQTFSNYEAEAEAQIESEDLNQQTRLLQDYSRMQELVNQTLNKFEPVPASDDDDELPPAEELAFLDQTVLTQLTDEQKRIGAMFDTVASAVSNTYHPIEREKSSGFPSGFRPTIEIADGGTLTAHTKSVWDALAVNIGEATKIIGQSSQIQMDSINKLSQQKNRHYELGSNVLNKITEILRAITTEE